MDANDQTEKRQHRPRRKAWIIVIMVTVVSLLAVGAVRRSLGIMRYQRVVSDLQARGQPTTIEALRALAPTTDARSQAALVAWMARANGQGYADPPVDNRDVQEWLSGLRQEPPHVMTDALHQHEALIRDGRAVLAARGCMDAYAGAAAMPFAWDKQVYVPGYGMAAPIEASHAIIGKLAPGTLSKWLRYTALATENPTSALHDLDQLIAVTAHPSSLTDAMRGMRIESIRDQAYGESAFRNRLSEADTERWLNESCDVRRILADGLRCERVIFTMSLARHIQRHPTDVGWFRTRPCEGWENIRSFYYRGKTVLFGLDDCVTLVTCISGMEARMRGDSADVSYIAIGTKKLSSLVENARYNLFESGQYTVQVETMHRLMRLAVRILRMSRSDGVPPADQATFLSRIGDSHALDGNSDHLYLRYELVTKSRFRLGVDPSMPVPNISDRARFKAFSRLGQPAHEIATKSATAYVPVFDIGQVDIEIETAAMP